MHAITIVALRMSGWEYKAGYAHLMSLSNEKELNLSCEMSAKQLVDYLAKSHPTQITIHWREKKFCERKVLCLN